MEASQRHSHSFVPALGFDWLTPLYDPLVRLALREDEVKQRLVDQSRIAPGMSVLDLGCGTGTLTLLVKRSHPTARVVGLDVDPQILEIARGKIAAAGVDIELRRGTVEEADFVPASFDRVVTSLVLHHMTSEEKLAALRAVREVLYPDGELHVADFGPPANPLMWLVSLPVRFFDGSDRVGGNLSGQLPAIMREAGFAEVEERGSVMTPFGTLTFWSAKGKR
ncbi:MAG: class I SAM-dependent methyltransferase [Deltaproteobacteria bacterium]|nr:class I SAM-dependent methyltransferase [Deltaproteobacteria bacterium]